MTSRQGRAVGRRGLMTLSVVVGLWSPGVARGSWLAVPPPLPAPTGNVVQVSTEPALQNAMNALTSGTTIVIAPGTYRLTRTLYVRGPLADVTIRGAGDSRDGVVLEGAGMTNASHGGVEFGIWVGGDVRRLTLANLTVREFYTHPIIMNAGPSAPRLYNIRLVNGGQQLLKTNPAGDGSGINDGVIEYSQFEYEPNSRDWYANAIQVLAGANWVIRNNLIRNIRAPQGEMAGPAVLAWFSASNTVVEGNTFINCQREISLGLIDRTPNDHSGGVVRNNFIYRDASIEGDVAIAVFDSPNTRVLHNTIFVGTAYPHGIEYRFPQTTGVLIANNLTNRPVQMRDGATATVQSNAQTATSDLFVSPATGNLHLAATASVAIDRGASLPEVTTDWDGAPRVSGGAADLGADEFSTATPPPPSTAPAAPRNLRVVPRS